MVVCGIIVNSDYRFDWAVAEPEQHGHKTTIIAAFKRYGLASMTGTVELGRVSERQK